MAADDAQPLPHPVTEHKARIEDRDDRIFPRHELAVDPHEHALVAGVRLRGVHAVGHVEIAYGHRWRRRARRGRPTTAAVPGSMDSTCRYPRRGSRSWTPGSSGPISPTTSWGCGKGAFSGWMTTSTGSRR